MAKAKLPKAFTEGLYDPTLEEDKKRQSSPLMQTNIIALDLVTDGIRQGDLIEISSEQGLGKTTLLLYMISKMLTIYKSKRIVYIDSEHAVKKSLLDAMGLNKYMKEDGTGRFVVSQLSFFEDVEETLEVFVDDGTDVAMIVVDSIAAIRPKSITETSVGDKTVAQVATPVQHIASKFKSRLRKYGVTLFIINQLRANIKMTKFGAPGPEFTTPGGNALKFFLDLQLRLTSGKNLYRVEKTPFGEQNIKYGNIAKLHALKNKNTRSFIKTQIPILYGIGVSNVMTMKIILEELGFVHKKGAGYWNIIIPDGDKGNLYESGQGRTEDELLLKVKKDLPTIHKIMDKSGYLKLSYYEEDNK